MIYNRKIRDTLVLNQDMAPLSMLPPTTVTWESAIKAIYGGHAHIVHEYDDWEVHSPSITLRVPSVIMVHKYVHYNKAVPWNEDYLYLRDRFRCQYCMKEFGAQHLTQDHVVPRKYGGKTCWENIVAACGPCNHRRGHNQNIRPNKMPYKPTYWELIDRIKEFELVIPDENWAPYLQWPEENLRIIGKPKQVLRINLAA